MWPLVKNDQHSSVVGLLISCDRWCTVGFIPLLTLQRARECHQDAVYRSKARGILEVPLEQPDQAHTGKALRRPSCSSVAQTSLKRRGSRASQGRSRLHTPTPPTSAYIISRELGFHAYTPQSSSSRKIAIDCQYLRALPTSACMHVPSTNRIHVHKPRLQATHPETDV